MEYLKYIFIGLTAVCEIVILFAALLSGKPFKMLFINAFLGLAAFALINIISRFTGIAIAVNEWTVGGAALFGLPSVVGQLCLGLII